MTLKEGPDEQRRSLRVLPLGGRRAAQERDPKAERQCRGGRDGGQGRDRCAQDRAHGDQQQRPSRPPSSHPSSPTPASAASHAPPQPKRAYGHRCRADTPTLASSDATVTLHTQRHPGGQDAARRPLPSPRPLPPFTSALNIRSVAIRSRNRGTSGRGSLRYLTSRLAAGSSSSFIRCSAALAVDSAAKPSGWTGSIPNSSAACLAWWYVSAAACAASRYSPTKRHTMSLMDSWSLVVVILPLLVRMNMSCHHRGCLRSRPG
jgi:hypothetical protein